MKLKVVILAFLFLGTASTLFAQRATFSTEASSTEVSVGEPFRVTFTIEDAKKISGFQAPDFIGFEVLQNSQNQSISIINGKTSRKQSFIFILRATAVGNFTIAAAEARIDGDETKSNPIHITVHEGSNPSTAPPSARSQQPQRQQPRRSPFSGLPDRVKDRPAILLDGEDPQKKMRDNVFVRVEVDKKEVYVGEQIVADYKLYTRLPTSSKVTKVPSFSGFSTHDLDVPNPVRPRATEVDGKEYEVFTFRKTILFPLQSGDQKLDPVQIENDVTLYRVEEGRGFDDPFSDFMDDPFFRDMFDDSFFRRAIGGGNHLVPEEHQYNMSSPVVPIHVKPLPEEGRPDNFDNAVGQFTISSNVDHTDITTDDAVTFTLTLEGKGNVDLISEPKVDFPNGLESYDPKISDDFQKTNPFGGSRTFTYVLMPNSTGKITIPAVQFSYFDPQKEEYETIHTAPHDIQVTQGKRKVDQPASSTSPEQVGNDLYPISNKNIHWKKSGTYWFGTWWHFGLLLLPLLILFLLLFWKKKNDELSADTIRLKNKKANKVALKRLKLAKTYLRKNDSKSFYEEISNAVWGYLSDKLSIPFADLNREEAIAKLTEHEIEEEDLKSLYGLLDRCEMALYAGQTQHKDLEQTYHEAITVISKLERTIKKKKNR